MFGSMCDNNRQFSFLSAIKDVGWAIIKRRCSKSVFIQSFMPFYFDIDPDMRENYLTELIHIYDSVNKNECTPDDILLKLGYYTQYINEYDEYMDELVGLEPYGSDMIIDLFDKHLMDQCDFVAIQEYIENNRLLFR